MDGVRYVYRCTLTLCEHTFYSSREVGAFFHTEPLIGNYALAYALGWAQAPYRSAGPPAYGEQLAAADARGLYVTPATFVPPVRFALAEWNAVSDTHWYAFANNAVVVRPDGALTLREGQTWYVQRPGEKRRKVGASNFPQHGRVKLLALGNRAVCYVIASEPVALPSYLRLGKWMSKARFEAEGAPAPIEERRPEAKPFLLNPADLPSPAALTAFDLVSVHPVPLVQNAVLGGPCLRAPDGVWLPAGMRFAPVAQAS